MNTEKLFWKDFISKPELDYLTLYFKAADEMIYAFCLNYDFDGDTPQIFITNETGFQAKSSADGKIYIPRDVIDWAENTNTLFPDSLTSTLNKKSASLVMILWIVAHEYFHIARSHIQLWAADKSLEDVLEYDADLISIAGLFRHFHHLMMKENSTITPLAVKEFVLRAVFFYVRHSMEQFPTDCNLAHKPFYIRLWWIMTKLAWVDNFNMETRIANQNYDTELEGFIRLIVEADKQYLTYNPKAAIDLPNLFLNFKDTIAPYIQPILNKWQTLEHIVRERQLINDQAGMPNIGKQKKIYFRCLTLCMKLPH